MLCDAGGLPVPVADHLSIFVAIRIEPPDTKPSSARVIAKVDYKLLRDKISQIDFCGTYDEDVK